jgi:hypothetical protein
MTVPSIIEELNKLPLTERLLIIEQALQTIRRESEGNLDQAVSSLYNDYKTDKELTLFTQLDPEPFYEAR